MGKQSQSRLTTPPLNHVSQRPERTESAGSVVLAELQARFAQFRAEHPRGTRVPAALRAAALAALGEGVKTTQLRRTCGISWGQLKAWKAGRESSRTRLHEDEGPTDVRVFSVVDAEPVEAPASVDPADGTLELKLGPWSVRVQLTGVTQRD